MDEDIPIEIMHFWSLSKQFTYSELRNNWKELYVHSINDLVLEL